MRVRTHNSTLDPMLGRVIRDFKVEEKLAEGGMGAVYLARHVLLPSMRKVIKVLLPVYAANPLICQRFHREAEAASKLRHDCILGIDNFGTLDDGQLFIMSPYLEGQPLDSYLRARDGRLAPHRALHLIVQLCDALDHAHGNGIIHRDLKPGNVFLVATDANPYALKLLDFGIAKVVGEDGAGPMTNSGTALGTPAYMAVEQYEHADEATHLSDVYSLAVMTWEMVTGRLPWQHMDRSVLYHHQRTVIPARPSEGEMPARWADVLLAALSVEPVMRPQSVRELAMALASALPAEGRTPSGAEILAGLVPRFLRNAAPGDETVRNAAGVDRIGPLIWPLRETAPDQSSEPPRAVSQPGGATPSTPSSAGGLPQAPRTTLSAATGVVVEATAPRAPRGKSLLAALGTVALTAAVTGGIAMRSSSDGGGAASVPASAPAALAPPVAAPAAPPPETPAPVAPSPPPPTQVTSSPPAPASAVPSPPASARAAAAPAPSASARAMDAGSAGTSLPAMKVAPAVKAPSAPAPATPVSGPRSPGTKAGSRPPASGSAAQKPDHLTPINPDDIYGP